MGKLYSTGENGYGQLGLGDQTDRNSVTQIGSATDWEQVAAGEDHSVAIKNGELWTWGRNNLYQLGNNTTTDQTSPIQIATTITNWVAVASGLTHSLALTSDGQVYSWGSNASGKTGQNTASNQTQTPTAISGFNDVSAIAAGAHHSLLIREDGTAWSFGQNTNGQLGLGDTTQRTVPIQIGVDTDFTKISGGTSHSLFIKGGKLFSCGTNGNGATGLNLSTGNTTTITEANGDTDWLEINAGDGYGLAIKSPGKLYAWGFANSGRLGNGTTTPNILVPTQIGSDQNWSKVSAARGGSNGLKAGALYSWGANVSGQLGLGNNTQQTSPTQVGSSTNWVAIDGNGGSFGSHFLAIESVNVAPANTAAPTLSGTAKVGQTLTTTDGTWTGTPTPTYAYKWQVSDNGTSGWSDISGATSSTFTLTSSQSGKYVRSQVTATNVAGSATASSSATTQIVENPAVSTPTISGTAKVGQVLTASASATAGFPSPSLSYQWQVADTSGGSYSNISGATSSTFTITSSEAGKYLRSSVTATNSEGAVIATSAATVQVATGVPTEGLIRHSSKTNAAIPTEGLIFWPRLDND